MCSSFIFVSVIGWPKEIQEGKEFIWLTISKFRVLERSQGRNSSKSREKWMNLCGSLPFSFRPTHMMQEPLCLGDGGCLINYQDNILQTYPQANLI